MELLSLSDLKKSFLQFFKSLKDLFLKPFYDLKKAFVDFFPSRARRDFL